MKRIKYIFFLTAMIAAPNLWAADFAVIVNKQNPESSIAKSELKALMFGNKTVFGGTASDLCLLGSQESDEFFHSVLGVSRQVFNQEWVKKELTGAGRAPKSRKTVEEVISCVTESKGGLGFIPKASADVAGKTVKILVLSE